MTEAELKAVLEDYVNDEMDSLVPEEMEGYDHEFSRKFNRKMRRLLWSEKYFGKKIHLGNAVRRAAAVVLIVGSLFAVDAVSASAGGLGIHPWQFIWSYVSGIGMEERRYTNVESTETETTARSIMPIYIPEGFEESFGSTEDLDYIYIEWEQGESLIQYSRLKLDEDTTLWVDAQYDSEREVKIYNYAGKIHQKDREVQVEWEDKSFYYSITATDYEGSEEELLKMAVSIY